MGLSPLVVKAVVLIDLNVWLYIVSILCIFIFIYWGIGAEKEDDIIPGW